MTVVGFFVWFIGGYIIGRAITSYKLNKKWFETLNAQTLNHIDAMKKVAGKVHDVEQEYKEKIQEYKDRIEQSDKDVLEIKKLFEAFQEEQAKADSAKKMVVAPEAQVQKKTRGRPRKVQ